jgi:hypothetical protein
MLFGATLTAAAVATSIAPAWHPIRFRTSGGGGGGDTEQEDLVAVMGRHPATTHIADQAVQDAEPAAGAAAGGEHKNARSSSSTVTVSTQLDAIDAAALTADGETRAGAGAGADAGVHAAGGRHRYPDDVGFSPAGGDARALRRTPLPGCALHVFRHVRFQTLHPKPSGPASWEPLNL